MLPKITREIPMSGKLRIACGKLRVQYVLTPIIYVNVFTW